MLFSVASYVDANLWGKIKELFWNKASLVSFRDKPYILYHGPQDIGDE